MRLSWNSYLSYLHGLPLKVFFGVKRNFGRFFSCNSCNPQPTRWRKLSRAPAIRSAIWNVGDWDEEKSPPKISRKIPRIPRAGHCKASTVRSQPTLSLRFLHTTTTRKPFKVVFIEADYFHLFRISVWAEANIHAKKAYAFDHESHCAENHRSSRSP